MTWSDTSPGFVRDVDWQILKPGLNCWRVERACRSAVLIDGAKYFRTLEASLRQARRSILILGWAFDGRIRLRPEADPEASPPLGFLLRSLVEQWPALEIRILVWSVAPFHAPGEVKPLILGSDWQNHPRLQLKLDAQHPIYAAHHQKVVCIDDCLAFAGGIDLTVRRWDTSNHALDNPHRVEPAGAPYSPVHDIQMVVEGEAARALSELARDRWSRACGEELRPIRDSVRDCWPAELAPEFAGVPVAIARTTPAWGDLPGASEAAALTVDALKTARRSIYIETQYLTASPIFDALAGRLSDPEGPEVVAITTHQSRGPVERLVMGENRDRLIRRLRQIDRYDRLRVYYPVVQAESGAESQVLMHAKLIVVDDIFLRVGSSNLNNRSIGLDTECDLAIEAHDRTTAATILQIRNRLVAEHLGVDPAELTAVLNRESGSLLRTIERLNRNARGLRPFQALFDRGPKRPAFGTRFLDPRQPFEPLWFLRRRAFRRRPEPRPP